MRIFTLLCVALIFGQILNSRAEAEVKLHGLFDDHMVLQRDLPIQIWGTASDDEKIKVMIADQTGETTAKDGKWKVTLKPISAGGPHTLTVVGANTIKREDVLIGEVWLCGGQSNMEINVKECEEPAKTIAAANHPQLRLITITRPPNSAGKRYGSATPVFDVEDDWAVCTPQSIPDFSAVAYHFGVALQKQLKVPVGLINSNMSGTPVERWISKQGFETTDKAVARSAKSKGASTCFNSLTHPLIPFGMRGVIWYQGETNENNAYRYRSLLPAMFKDWRTLWGQGDFPFLYVQIAPWHKKQTDPMESAMAEVRESQLLTLASSPNTAMVVLTDLGDEEDHHPLPKQPVGERLALAARAKAYGEKIEYSGPVYESISFDGDKAVIKFTHVGKGLVVKGDQLTGFTIAGDNKKFVNATAVIKDDTVIVSSANVGRPIAVRYGWADYPVVNLWNKDGLPASPFRTDQFPGLTIKN